MPIKLLDRCVIHGAPSKPAFDTGVLMKLAEAGVTTTLMSPRSPRRVALVLGRSTTMRQYDWRKPSA